MKWDVSDTSLPYFSVPNWGASVKHPAAIGEKQPFRIIAANGPTLPLGIRQYMLKLFKQSEQPFRVSHTAAARYTNFKLSINPDAVCVLDSHRLL